MGSKQIWILGSRDLPIVTVTGLTRLNLAARARATQIARLTRVSVLSRFLPPRSRRGKVVDDGEVGVSVAR